MTINEAVYKYIKSVQPSGFNGFFYMENNKDELAPYGTIYLIEDPKEKTVMCQTDQGDARFAIDVFTTGHKTGWDLRQSMADVINGMPGTTTEGYKIQYADTINFTDRAESVTGLYQYSFEAIITYEK